MPIDAVLVIAQRILLPTAIAIGLFSFGWHKGASHTQKAWDAEHAQLSVELTHWQMQAKEAEGRVVTQYVDRVQTVQAKSRTIIQKVSMYVPSTTPDLPAGFRLFHDAAAAGSSLLKTATVTDATPVPVATAAVTVAGNYDTCRVDQERLRALQAWAVSQSGVN